MTWQVYKMPEELESTLDRGELVIRIPLPTDTVITPEVAHILGKEALYAIKVFADSEMGKHESA
jgi:hypothetical protein